MLLMAIMVLMMLMVLMIANGVAGDIGANGGTDFCAKVKFAAVA